MSQKDCCVVPAGSVTVKGRLRTCPSSSTATLVPASKRSDWSWLLGVHAGVRAVTLACRRPAPLGATETPTLGPVTVGGAAGLGDATGLGVRVGVGDTGMLVGV